MGIVAHGFFHAPLYPMNRDCCAYARSDELQNPSAESVIARSG